MRARHLDLFFFWPGDLFENIGETRTTNVFSKLRFANTLIPPSGPDKGGGPPSPAEQPLTFKCTKAECTFEADTSQKLAIHMFKIHQVKSIWKNYIILRWLQVKVVGCEVVGCKFAEVMHHITKGNAGYIPQNKICSRKFSQGSSIGRTSSKST